MLPASTKMTSAPLLERKAHAAGPRRPKALAPRVNKKGAELKCSAPIGPLPRLAAAKGASSI